MLFMFWVLTNTHSHVTTTTVEIHNSSVFAESPQCSLAAPAPGLHPLVCFLSLWFRLFQNVTHYAAFEVWLLSLHDSSRLSCVSVVHLFLWMRTFPCVDRPQHSPKETQAILVFSDHEKQSDPHTWELLP